MTTTDNQWEQTAKTNREQASKMRRHQQKTTHNAKRHNTQRQGNTDGDASTAALDVTAMTKKQRRKWCGAPVILSSLPFGSARTLLEFARVFWSCHTTATIRLQRALRWPQTTRLQPNIYEQTCAKILAKPLRKADWNPNWANAKVTSRNHDKIGGTEN